jgi:type I restriction enzyme, S subunit
MMEAMQMDLDLGTSSKKKVKVAGMTLELPKNWQCSICSDVIDTRDGTHDTPKYLASGYPLVTSKNLKDGKIDFSTVSYISEADHREIAKRSGVVRGDIILAMIGTIGNPVLVDIDTEFSIKNVALFKCADSEVIDSKYFKYLLSSPIIGRQLDFEERGGTQKFVSLRVLRNLLIPYPPLAEQKRIAAILDKADRIRQKRKETIRLTEELLRSAFLEMFGDPVTNPKGWEVQPITAVAASSKNSLAIGPFGSSLKVEHYQKEGHPVVFIRDIRENKFNWISNIFLDDHKYKELSSHHVAPGDIVATKMGLPPCIAAVYPNSMPIGVITADIIKMTMDLQKATPYYISSIINSDYCKQQVARFTEGVTRPKVNLGNFKSLKILCPPLEKQQQWDIFYLRHQQTLQHLKNNLEISENLFNALLQRAFKGQL